MPRARLAVPTPLGRLAFAGCRTMRLDCVGSLPDPGVWQAMLPLTRSVPTDVAICTRGQQSKWNRGSKSSSHATRVHSTVPITPRTPHGAATFRPSLSSPSHGLPPDAMGLAKVDLDHGYLVVRSAPRQIQLSSPRSPPFSSRQGVPPFVPGDPSPSDRFPISRVMFGVGRQPGAAGASRGLPSTYIRFPACLPRSVCSCMTAVLDSCRRLHATLLPGLPLPRPQQPICWSFTQYFVSRLR